ncbi:FAD/NAD(P)-binding protein [Aestuariivirga sp.]|uniref:FAD/NAD(P)-binding protein n=1 Tax=Aestuariivirga sp. TaxID=2650926 RepID=UPI003BA9BC8E
MRRFRIAIIGAGPTALYCLKHLTRTFEPLMMTIFSPSDEFGNGMPFTAKLNGEFMLCNAFSREIPPVTQTLLQWLQQLPARELNDWELSRHELSGRAFYPRVLIGDYLKDAFKDIAKLAEGAGHDLKLVPNACISDVRLPRPATVVIDAGQEGSELEFDALILATGHSWDGQPALDKATLISPWPYTNVTSLPPGNIGVLGSSLSAIDAVLALGFARGDFSEDKGQISWHPRQDAETLRITMVSKSGVMPEGDFYYPFPYLPLLHITEDAVAAEVSKGQTDLLHRVFLLLKRELSEADPGYLARLGSDAETIEGFCEFYFKDRTTLGGLAAVKDGFAEARQSMRDRRTIPHRYVLLRAHETFDRALRVLNEEDWKTFQSTLHPVFGDAYAAVPHLSLARIIAMYDAGVLDLVATGEDALFEDQPEGGVDIVMNEERLHFDAMVDCRGQASAPLDDLPFPHIVRELVDGQSPIAEPFKIKLQNPGSAPIYCLSMPQLLERHPFAQGLSETEGRSAAVVNDLMSLLKADAGPKDQRQPP